MIWQRSVVAKEKVRTIEVNDYGCKIYQRQVDLTGYILFPMKTLQKIIGIMLEKESYQEVSMK
jgi:hypothetical protein